MRADRPANLQYGTWVEQEDASRAKWAGWLILLVFMLTIFEGAARKWLFSGTPPLRYAAYFSKDIVFVLAAFATYRPSKLTITALAVLLPLSAALLLFPTMANLSSTSAVGAVLSFRAYIIMPLCAFIVAGSLGSYRTLDRVALIVGLCTIGIAILGVRQYSLPQSHFLNRYDTGEEQVHIIAHGAHVRATGTFSFISGMNLMTGVGAWAGMYLFLTETHTTRRLFALAVLVSAICCGLAAMSHGAVVLWFLTVLGGVALFRRLKESIYLIVPLLVAFMLFHHDPSETSARGTIEEGIQARTKTGMYSQRAEFVWDNFQKGILNHPLGEGLGVGQPGGWFASTGHAKHRIVGYESELGRICYEVGVLGFCGVMLWRIFALGVIWKAFRSARSDRTRALIACSLPLLGVVCFNWMAFNHTGSSFAWSILALCMGAYLQQEREATVSSSLSGRQIGHNHTFQRPLVNRRSS
jgi:hypothetical protein